MELFFLGTSSGVPSKGRNVSGIALCRANSKSWCLVDCGEASQHQLLHLPLSLSQLDTLLITHLHGDHCYGLPGLLASASMQGRSAPLRLVGPADLWPWLQATCTYTHLHLSFALEFHPLESLQAPLMLAEFELSACPLAHRVPSYAYAFCEKRLPGKLDEAKLRHAGIPAGPLWGQLHRGEQVEWQGQHYHGHDFILSPRAPRRVIISGDNAEPSCLAPLLPADLLVHEATYSEEVLAKVGPGPMHCSAARIARYAGQAGIPNLLLTHFSPRYQRPSGPLSIQALQQEAAAVYAGRLLLAEDLRHYRLTPEGQLERGESYRPRALKTGPDVPGSLPESG